MDRKGFAGTNLQSPLIDDLHRRFYFPLLAFFTRRLKNKAEAEDLAQETLLKVIASPSLSKVKSAESYIFTIALNLLRDHARKSTRAAPNLTISIDQALKSEFEQQLVEDLSAERVLIGRDTLREALRVIDELDERTRDIFILFRLENMKQKDIAALYGCAQSTVEKHVMRAMLHLTQRLALKPGQQ